MSPSLIMETIVSRFPGTGVRSRAVSRRKRFMCWWYTCVHRKLKSLMSDREKRVTPYWSRYA